VLADRAAAGQQRRPGRDPGARRRARRRASRCTRTRWTRRWRSERERRHGALRTQQIIAEESGVTNTVDPLAGSYAIEALTDRIETEARDYIEQIDRIGGIVRAIELGFPQKEIAEARITSSSSSTAAKRLWSASTATRPRRSPRSTSCDSRRGRDTQVVP
jgi:hypothetical protein